MSNSQSKPTILCVVEIVAQTEKAVLLQQLELNPRMGSGYFGTSRKSWFPKSCVNFTYCSSEDMTLDQYEVEIQEWIATKNGFLPSP